MSENIKEDLINDLIESKPKSKRNKYNAERATRYRAYRNEYVKKNIKQYLLRLNVNQEEDVRIINKLSSVDNVTGYIVGLIKADIEREENGK